MAHQTPDKKFQPYCNMWHQLIMWYNFTFGHSRYQYTWESNDPVLHLCLPNPMDCIYYFEGFKTEYHRKSNWGRMWVGKRPLVFLPKYVLHLSHHFGSNNNFPETLIGWMSDRKWTMNIFLRAETLLILNWYISGVLFSNELIAETYSLSEIGIRWNNSLSRVLSIFLIQHKLHDK